MTITGEATVDNRYEGRGGIDTFMHLGGDDTLGDFDPLTETLIVRVSGLDQAQIDAAIANGVAQGGDTLVTFGSGTVLFSGLSHRAICRGRCAVRRSRRGQSGAGHGWQ